MEPDIEDLRSGDRYILTEKLSGSFGSAPVTLLDVGEQGVQIEHAQPLIVLQNLQLAEQWIDWS